MQHPMKACEIRKGHPCKLLMLNIGAFILRRYHTILIMRNHQNSLLQQPGPQKFKLSKIELIYKAKKFKVPLFTI